MTNDLKALPVVRRFDASRDAPSLRDCVVAQQDFHRNLEPSWPEGQAIVDDYVAYLEAECAAENGCIFIADYGEQTVGFVCVVAATRGQSPDDPALFAWIYDIYVKPEYRGRGVATLLMAEAERFARGQGARVLRLAVLNRNEHARAFYAGRGFRVYSHVLTKPLDPGP